MSSVEIYVPIDIIATLARDAMLELMPRIEKGEHPYETLSLSVAHVESRPFRWECGLELTASHEQGMFPTFRGSISVTPLTNDACELWLLGEYDPPLGATGVLLDATVFHGTALRTLRTFLDWLAKEVLVCALETEKRQTGQALSHHMGG